MSAFPKIKLTYFAAAGRAEAQRLAFYVGGVPFVDERLTGEQFAAIKNTLPLGQLPILEVDGVVLTQSEAILRYAGRVGGLYPTNAPLEALKIDEVIHGMGELVELMGPAFNEKDPEKKKAMREELATVAIPRYAKLIEARLEQLQKYPVFQTDKLFIHEIAIYAWVKSLRAGYIDHIPVTVLDGYTLINAAHKKVEDHPKVKEWYSMNHNTPKLKLTYMPIPGRAEPIRLALFMANIPFEDERISRDELEARRSSLPFNQLPVLEIDGEVISQSLALLRYAGALSGLYPTNDPLEAYKIDEIFALIDDIHNAWKPSYKEKDPEKQLVLRQELAKGAIPKHLGLMDKRIGNWNSPYATSAHLTVADLALYALVEHLTSGKMVGVPTTITDAFANVRRVHDQVAAHPKVVEWNQTHASN